jgi:hypothetical protein
MTTQTPNVLAEKLWYVYARHGTRTALLAGPVSDEATARRLVAPARELAEARDRWAWGYEFGHLSGQTRPGATPRSGRFNVLLNVEVSR